LPSRLNVTESWETGETKNRGIETGIHLSDLWGRNPRIRAEKRLEQEKSGCRVLPPVEFPGVKEGRISYHNRKRKQLRRKHAQTLRGTRESENQTSATPLT